MKLLGEKLEERKWVWLIGNGRKEVFTSPMLFRGCWLPQVKCNLLLWLIIPPYRASDKTQEEVLAAQGHWITHLGTPWM